MANDNGTDDLLSPVELEESLADAEKPQELRAGTYVGEVQDVQGKVSAAGNPYYAIKFVIANEDLPADMQDENPDGVALFWNRVMKPVDARSRYNYKLFMEALGLDVNVTVLDPNEFMSCRARLRVKPETYNGNTRPVIQTVEAAEKQAPKVSGRGRSAQRQEPEDEAEEEVTPRRGRPPGKAATRGRATR